MGGFLEGLRPSGATEAWWAPDSYLVLPWLTAGSTPTLLLPALASSTRVSSATRRAGFGGHLPESSWLHVWLGTGDLEQVAWPLGLRRGLVATGAVTQSGRSGVVAAGRRAEGHSDRCFPARPSSRSPASRSRPPASLQPGGWDQSTSTRSARSWSLSRWCPAPAALPRASRVAVLGLRVTTLVTNPPCTLGRGPMS